MSRIHQNTDEEQQRIVQRYHELKGLHPELSMKAISRRMQVHYSSLGIYIKKFKGKGRICTQE